MKTRFVSLATATCVAAILLTGCAGPEEPQLTLPPTVAPKVTESPKPKPTPTPTVTAAPEETPVTEPAPVPAGDQTINVDNWATLTAPAGWTVISQASSQTGMNNMYLLDGNGKKRLSFYYERPERVYDVPACTPSATPLTIIETKPLDEAYPAENIQRSTYVKEITTYDSGNSNSPTNTQYELITWLNETDRTAGTNCEPFSAIYPDTGGFMQAAITADPFGSLYFNTEDEATSHATSAEYQENIKIMDTIRITP